MSGKPTFNWWLRWAHTDTATACLSIPAYTQEEPNLSTSETAHSQNLIATANSTLSAVIDAFYYNENSENGLSTLKEEMPGFGHTDHEERKMPVVLTNRAL